MTTSISVPALDRNLIGCLCADMITSTWTVENLQALIDGNALSALMRSPRLPTLAEFAGTIDPVAILTCFFVLSLSERASVLNEVLPTLGAYGLEPLGLVATIDEAEATSVLIIPRAGGAPRCEPKEKREEFSSPRTTSAPTMRDSGENAPEPEVEEDPWM